MKFIKNLARKIYKIFPDSYLKKSLTGLVYRILYRKVIKNYFYKNGLFYIETIDGVALKSVKDFDPEPILEDFEGYSIKEGMTVIDLGGNIGMVSVYLSKKIGMSGEVYVYEPDDRNFLLLNENIKINGASNTKAIQKGIWKSEGTLAFYDGGNYTSSFHETNYIEQDSGQYNVVNVPVTTLDNEVKRIGMKKLDLIKIDIEGSEVEALEGAAETLQRFHPDLIIETHIVKGISTKEKVHETLKNFGYKNIRVSGNYDSPAIFALY